PIGCAVDFVCRLLHLKIISLKKPLQIGLCNKADKNKTLLNDYVQRYTDLLDQSRFFNRSNNSFGTNQASNLLASLDDNSFFEAGHKLSLKSKHVFFSELV
ncbi:hypothetical protein ACG9H7_14250, partial [Acinetobacter wanghuae]